MASNSLREKIDNIFYQKIVRWLLSLSKLGRASTGGTADSGLNFDHMYRNKPKGITIFGKFVDKVLLNLPSVKATRNRKDIIIKILQNEIANNMVIGRKTKIVDIASGPARYLTDLLNTFNQDMIEILCLDRDRRSLNFGKVLAGRKPIRYTKANIFKLNRLKNLSSKIEWGPNIIISSGLFEYLKDDEVKNILSEAYKNIEDNGLFIFATQKDNPSKELMSRVCVMQNGDKWELTYRNPEVLRKWILEAGFKGAIISVDKWGMYEFCTGRK